MGVKRMSELSQSIDRLNRKANILSRQARESKEHWITLRLPQTEMVLRELRKKADKMIQVDPLDLQVLVKKDRTYVPRKSRRIYAKGNQKSSFRHILS